MRGLTFERYGRPDARALVCLHGFMGSPLDWRAFAEALPDWQVVAVALPGHDGHAPVDFGSRLIATMDALGLVQAGLVGYSLGGRLGLAAALDYPNRFPVFVGVSTTAGLEEDHERLVRLSSDQLLAERLRNCDSAGFEIFLREWRNLPVFDSPRRNSDGLEQFVASRRAQDPRLVAECLESWSPGALPSLWGRLSEYPGRALLVAGECDQNYSRIAERMARGFRLGSQVTLAGCGHRILEEDSEGLARCVSRFVETANFGIGRTARAD